MRRPSLISLLPVLIAAGLGLAACSEPPRNVVIVTLDTTRRDRLSLYGYSRPTTPAIDALAAQGFYCLNAWSQAPNTCPSIASSLTSRRAPITTVRGNAEPLAAGVPTIAQVARDAGYRTGGFVSTVLLRRDVSGLAPGFETYDDEMTDPCFGHPNAQRVARNTIDRALTWLDDDDGRPFLLWVHLYDPHGPYSAPEPTPELDASNPVLPESVDLSTWPGADKIPKYLRVPGLTTPQEYADAYDRELRYADDQLARLFARLDLENTVVALHADHGEAHGEDRYWFRHGNLLHDPALQIPMVFAGPGVSRGWSRRRIRNLDLAPTVAALAGLPPLPDAEGGDMRLVLQGRSVTPGRAPLPFVAEGRRREIVGDQTGIDVRWKLRYYTGPIDVTWWPAADERNVAAGTPEDVVTAMDTMRAWLSVPGEEAAPGAIDDDVDAALRGLGYTSPGSTRTPKKR